MGNCLGSQAAASEAHSSNGDNKISSGGGKSSGNVWSSNETNSNFTTATDSTFTNGSLNSGPVAGGDGPAPLPTNGVLKAFTYSDLKSATRNFRPDSLLGEGGFGRVFKGHIDEQTYLPTRPGQGILIAVKKLNTEGVQGQREWMAELNYLGTLRHPNLVKLIGFCADNDNYLLVYEFMPRGSLDNHLFRKGHTLAWPLRMKIALHAAKGLAFLHNAKKPIIYRDFKSPNILLDSEFNAKLSDFGLAKDGPTGDKTHVTTRVMGTYGYAAPEYVATGRLTAKSDVYGYGVVLLEIMTGRRAVDKNRAGGEQNLVEWAAEYLNDKRTALRIMDQRLDGQYSRREAQKTAQLALRCLNEDAKMRPTMQQIVDFLETMLDGRKRGTDSGPGAAGDASPYFSSSPYRSPLRQ